MWVVATPAWAHGNCSRVGVIRKQFTKEIKGQREISREN